MLLVGLPGCGKTTLANQLRDLDPTIQHICFDQLQEEQTTESWHEAKQIAFKKCQEHILSNPSMIILDDNFEYKSMRKPYFKLA
jgi:broad-specificity NMP kinase